MLVVRSASAADSQESRVGEGGGRAGGGAWLGVVGVWWSAAGADGEKYWWSCLKVRAFPMAPERSRWVSSSPPVAPSSSVSSRNKVRRPSMSRLWPSP